MALRQESWPKGTPAMTRLSVCGCSIYLHPGRGARFAEIVGHGAAVVGRVVKLGVLYDEGPVRGLAEPVVGGGQAATVLRFDRHPRSVS